MLSRRLGRSLDFPALRPSLVQRHGAGMQGRLQRTIRQSVETSGIGFLTGRDVRIGFRPAAVESGNRVPTDRLPGIGADSGPDRVCGPPPATDGHRAGRNGRRNDRTRDGRPGGALDRQLHRRDRRAGTPRLGRVVVAVRGIAPERGDCRAAGDRGRQSLSSETVFVGEPKDESEITYRPADPAGPGDHVSSRLRAALADSRAAVLASR